MNGALGADRIPEQQMVPDDGGGASQSDTCARLGAAADTAFMHEANFVSGSH